MKTILGRLQQLERSQSAQTAANDASGAKEMLLARLSKIAERMKGVEGWPPEPRPTVEEVKQRISELLTRTSPA